MATLFLAGAPNSPPLSSGGMGIPHLGLALASMRIKNLLKLARGQLSGIPVSIVRNLGLNLSDILRLNNIELSFLALSFKRLNLHYWHQAVKDYISFRQHDIIERNIDLRLYESFTNTPQLKTELNKLSKCFDQSKVKSPSFFNVAWQPLLSNFPRTECLLTNTLVAPCPESMHEFLTLNNI